MAASKKKEEKGEDRKKAKLNLQKRSYGTRYTGDTYLQQSV